MPFESKRVGGDQNLERVRAMTVGQATSEQLITELSSRLSAGLLGVVRGDGVEDVVTWGNNVSVRGLMDSIVQSVSACMKPTPLVRVVRGSLVHDTDEKGS